MSIQLTSLLSGQRSFLLAYSIPLLLSSLLVTFAGTFLTFYRTRTFAPPTDYTTSLPGSYNEKSRDIKNRLLQLDGGLGGIAIGHIFGLHLSTIIALSISNKARSPLDGTLFLVIWLLVALSSSVIGGRWRLAAISFIGITAGISFSLFLCILTHSPLASRIIIISVITPLIALTVLITSIFALTRQSVFSQILARIATSCSGSFSMTVAIALLTGSVKFHSWANVWDRLWLFDSSEWETSTEKGMTALFCILWILGSASDWSLKKYFGENSDEHWDAYLAEYSAAFPNSQDRAGKFHPLQSRLSRFLQKFHITSASTSYPRDMMLSTDSDIKDYMPISKDLIPNGDQKEKHEIRSQKPFSWESGVDLRVGGLLRKNKTSRSVAGFRSLSRETNTSEDLRIQSTCLQKTRKAKTRSRREKTLCRNRTRIEFRPKNGFSSASDSSDADDDITKSNTIDPRDSVPKLPARTHSSSASLSGTTIYDSSNSGHPTVRPKVEDIDIEYDKARIAAIKTTFGSIVSPNTRARTLLDYSDVEEDVTAGYTRASSPVRDVPGWKPGFLRHLESSNSVPGAIKQKDSLVPPPNDAVPLTPSLITAIGRIAKTRIDIIPYEGGETESSPR